MPTGIEGHDTRRKKMQSYLCYISRDDGDLCHCVQDVIQPSWKKCPAGLGKVETSYGA